MAPEAVREQITGVGTEVLGILRDIWSPTG
jgi:hypothetical protein